MPSATTDLLVTAAPGLRQAALDWAEHLGHERRLAAKTLEAYRRDLEQFLRFLTGHLGEPPSPAAISALRPADVRAFMAQRRTEGAGARTLGRQIAALRSFARFCERRGIAATTAFLQRPPAEAAEEPAEGAFDRRQRRADRDGRRRFPRSRGSPRATSPC